MPVIAPPRVRLEEFAKVVFLNNVKYSKNNLIDSTGPRGKFAQNQEIDRTIGRLSIRMKVFQIEQTT